MTKENSNEQALLNLILEELQQSNQQLATQQVNIETLSQRINQAATYDFPERKVEELKNSLQQYHARLLQPVPAKVRHYFYVHTTTVIALLFFIGLITLAWMYMDKIDEARSLKSSAVKYRHLKLSENTSLARLLNATDSLYANDPGYFERNVEDRERNRENQLQFLPKKKNGKRKKDLLPVPSFKQ